MTEQLGGRSTSTWDSSYRLALGDELVGGRSWKGEIRQAAVVVDGATVDYVQPLLLDLPRRTAYMPARLAEVTRVRFSSSSDAAVVLLHILAFVPIGFLLQPLVGRRMGTVAWLTACLLLVVLLEQGKVFVAGRHPSVDDMCAYIAGAVAGGAASRRQLLVAARRRPTT